MSVQRGCGLVGALLLLAASGACSEKGDGGSGKGSSKRPSNHAEGVALAAPVYQALEEIADNFPELDTLQPKKCEGVELKKLAGLSWNSLMKITGGEVSAAEKEVWDLARLVNVGKLDRLPPKAGTPKHFNGSNYTEALEQLGRRTHVNVLRIAVGKATRAASSTFQGGYAGGYMVVFEIASRKPVCWWPVSAQSSQKVSYSIKSGDHAGAQADKARYAVKQDLKRQMEKSLFDARAEMLSAQ